jgi:hypothetical protein
MLFRKINSVYSESHIKPAGPSGRAVWGLNLDCLGAETIGSNPA